jgi:hypothetical protein
VSRRTYEKIKQVAEAAEKEPERFGDLPAKMDEQSVDAAHKEMRRRQQVPSDDPPPLPESEALEYPDPEEDDTEPSQFEDDLADDDEPDTRAPVCGRLRKRWG